MYRFFEKTKQLLTDKWQSFRTWQEHPITYRMDKEKHVCNNCGHTFTGNYCPVCSQSARHGRITWLALWQGIGQLWGVESRSGLYTLWQLLWRPGYLVRDFVSGKRQVSYPPVKLLFILAAVVTLVQYFFPIPAPELSQTGFAYIDHAVNWMNTHQNIGELLTGCIFILPTWLLFRKAPGYPNHTIPEGFFLQVYIAVLSYIIQAVFASLNIVAIVLTSFYSFVTYKQFFGYGFWQTLWRWMVCTVLSLATFLMIVMMAIFIDVLACHKQPSDTFAWNKATVYFVLVDRFCNGDSTNDRQYGRCTDYGSERMKCL